MRPGAQSGIPTLATPQLRTYFGDSSKTTGTIFMKLWDIVPNNIRVINLHLTKNMPFCCYLVGDPLKQILLFFICRKLVELFWRALEFCSTFLISYCSLHLFPFSNLNVMCYPLYLVRQLSDLYPIQSINLLLWITFCSLPTMPSP